MVNLDVQYLGNEMGSSQPSKRFRQLYSFTTENLAGYMPKSLSGSVVTVCGSGDHALNAILSGATRVLQFDLNLPALLWSELKCVALCNLDYQDYLNFFLLRAPSKSLCYQTFKSLKTGLSEVVKSFFEQEYARYDFCGYKLRTSKLFNLNYDLDHLKQASNTYLNSKQYYQQLQTCLPEVSILQLQCCIKDLHKHLNGSFTCIFLSNIADYLSELYPEQHNPLRSFSSQCVSSLLPYLNSEGELYAAYIYGSETATQDPRSQIDIYRQRISNFSQLPVSYREESFKGVIPNQEDTCVILKSL